MQLRYKLHDSTAPVPVTLTQVWNKCMHLYDRPVWGYQGDNIPILMDVLSDPTGSLKICHYD